MQYWGHMHDKYGFDDGELVSVGAEEHRTVYIRFLNARLQRFESNVRVFAYNRTGVHSDLLIRCAPADVVLGLTAAHIEGGDFALAHFDEEEVDFDDAYFVAVEDAMEADLDRYVEATMTISSNFEQALQGALALFEFLSFILGESSMSRGYRMTIVIKDARPDRHEPIRQAVEAEWSMDDWDVIQDEILRRASRRSAAARNVHRAAARRWPST